MLKSGKRLILVIIAAVLVLVLLGLWAKHDADAKAKSFVSANVQMQATYKTQVAKLQLSSLIDIKDNGNEDAVKEQAVCSTAESLQKSLNKFNNNGLQGSLGGWLSGQYGQAQKVRNVSQTARNQAVKQLSRYSARCQYFAKSTEISNKIKAIQQSNEYKSQLSFSPLTCSGIKTGCILPANYSSFAKVYAKVVQTYEEYETYYKQAKCPLNTSQQKICADAVTLATATADNARQYLAALQSRNTTKLGHAAAYVGPTKAYNQFKADAKRLDPTAKSIDDYWRKMFITEEKQLQQLAI